MTITEPLLLLLVVPPFVAGVCLVFFGRTVPGTLAGLGLLGLGAAGWVDLADNCLIDQCAENDPFLLSATWFASGAALVAGTAAGSVRLSRRRRRSSV
jgi:hypothetical protein